MRTKEVDSSEQVGVTRMLQADESVAALQSMGGLQLADYKLVRRLGAGGYGEVWEAIGPGGLTKAVKVLHGEHSGTHAEAEVKALERMRDLRHPFLLNIERIEVVNSRLVVVTELADGNLSQRFEECRADSLPGIPRDELLGYLKDVADALDFMSAKHGLQHLDIKPDNILLQGDHAKVGDFGLAKDLNVANVSVINGFTPTFAAPELFEGRPGRASDQYSLAIVYQFMLTGTLPFNGRTAAQLTAQHLRSQPDLANLQPIDRPVVARALSKNLHARYESCRQFVDELARRKHGHNNHRAAPQQRVDCELMRTALFKTQHGTESDADIRTASSPVRVTPVPETGQALRAAVVIGVGGLAGTVLHQLRTLTPNCEDGAQVPVLQIDTDRAALAALQAKADSDGLAAAETLAIPLRSSKDYRNSSGLDLSWLSRRWLFNIPRSGQVEGIRPLGRLALFDHRQAVRRRLEELLREAVAGCSDNSSDVSRGVDVYIVAGTAGGTGSGAVADVGLMVREVVDQISTSDIEIHGVLLHATGAMRNVTDVQEANTVCTLQELAHLATPGLGTPRGFDTSSVNTDARPFDHSYLIHLGDGLSQQEFADEAGKVATYLLDATTTTAQLDFRAWRETDTEDQGHQLRLLGISCQDGQAFHTAASEAENLCTLLLRRWCGFLSSAGQLPLPAELTDTRTMLGDLKLTKSTLPQQVRALLKGRCGTEIEAYAEDVTRRLNGNGQLAASSRGQILDLLTGELAQSQEREASSETSLHQIVSELQASLINITRYCEQTLTSQLSSVLDTPHRLEGATAAASYTSATLRETASSCESALGEIEAAFDRLGDQKDADLPISSGDDPTNQDAVEAFCREYCVLLAYQTIYQCFINHVKTVAKTIEAFKNRLNSLKQTLESLAAEIASTTVLTDAMPQPIIDAFDRHLRSVYPELLSGYLAAECPASDFASRLSGAAANFLMAAAGRGGHATDRGATGNDEFPQNAWPRFRGSGGRRRVLSLVPTGSDWSDLEQKLRQEFDDCVAVRATGGDHLAVFCEIDGVPVETIINRLTHSNPSIADVASRIHTRIDIDW